MDRITKTVLHLVIIHTIFLVITEFNLLSHLNIRGLLPLYYFENTHFHWWQYISYMFLHADFMHLFFNMYALWAFGSPLENIWGRNKFLFFYFSCGVGAALLQTAVNYYHVHQGLNALAMENVDPQGVIALISDGRYYPYWETIINKSTFDNMASALASTTIGASGAIYGILVAFGMFFPDTKLMMLFIPYPIAARYFIPIIVGLDLVLGITGSGGIFGGNIAHFAHIGGALIGFLIMLYWKRHSKF